MGRGAHQVGTTGTPTSSLSRVALYTLYPCRERKYPADLLETKMTRTMTTTMEDNLPDEGVVA
jgi:hypothetical protein